MKPRDFCREWFGDSATETDRGYKERCLELLSQITGLGVEAVEKWGRGKDGKGLEFAKMPAQYEKTLAYAMALKRIANATYKGSPTILEAVLEQLKSQNGN